MRAIVWAAGISAMGIATLAACATLDNLSNAPSPEPAGDAGSEAATPSTSDASDSAAPACSSNLETDAKHCGRCGHDCLGGTCAKGECQAMPLIAERSNLFGLVVDATHAYYYENGTGLVGRVAKAGGAAEPVCPNTSGSTLPFAVDDTAVYCSTSAGIARVAKVGLAQTVILAGSRDINALFVDATNVYGVGSGSFKVAKTGGTAVALPIQAQNTGPTPAAHDANDLYANHSFDGIYVSSKTNTAPAGVRLFLAVPEPSGIALDATHAYVSVRTTGTVKRVPKAGGTATNIVTGVTAPRVIAVDDKMVFFGTGDGDIMACPIDGCTAPPRVLAEKQGDLYGIAVDSSAVYWSSRTNGTVMRVAK